MLSWKLVVTAVAVIAAVLFGAAPGLSHVPPGYEKHYALAKRVVYKVFPDATQYRALSVVHCETGHRYLRGSRNRRSGTTGLFQIHPGNVGRVVYWHGHGSITIPSNLTNAWVNARVALYLSHGGRDWHEWAPVCRR